MTENTPDTRRWIDADHYLAFVDYREHWSRPPGSQPDINVKAAYTGDPSVLWSFRVVQHDAGISVEIFDDAFPAFAQIPEFFTALASRLTDIDCTLDEIHDLLVELGAVDQTVREKPYNILFQTSTIDISTPFDDAHLFAVYNFDTTGAAVAVVENYQEAMLYVMPVADAVRYLGCGVAEIHEVVGNGHCRVHLQHPDDRSDSLCILDADHQRTDTDHVDSHGCRAPVLVRQATIDEVARVDTARARGDIT